MKKKILIVLVIVILLTAGFFILSGIGEKNNEEIHKGNVPIVYHEDYNITLYGIENFHPFDSCKYAKVFNKLSKKYSLNYDDFYHPSEVRPENLLYVHSAKYLLSLKDGETVEKIVEIPGISWLPDSVLDEKILYPMRLATGGSMLAVDVALEKGWAINLSGGYHHAKRNEGDGFCVYGDIALAADKFLRKEKAGRVLIIDLDAHQGNGPESMLQKELRVVILDVYNDEIYPHDNEVEKYIRYPGQLHKNTEDKEYLAIVQNLIEKAYKENDFDLVIYNAGTDIYEADELGELKISREGIIKRDEIVFKEAIKRKIPIIMVLSGGYTQESGEIVADSIINLVDKGIIKL